MITTPQSNRVEIVRNETNIKNLTKKIDHIEKQVSNHIPTQIRNLDRKLATVIAIVGILQAIMFLLISKYIQ